MRSGIGKLYGARIVALGIALGMCGSLALAPPSWAGRGSSTYGTAPQVPGGVACNPSDGKISGRGSSFQDNALYQYILGYENDVCGNVGADPNLGSDPSGVGPSGNSGFTTNANGMVSYNYVKASATINGETVSSTGSGGGLEGATCRTDGFFGSDFVFEGFQSEIGAETFDQGTGNADAAQTFCGAGNEPITTPPAYSNTTPTTYSTTELNADDTATGAPVATAATGEPMVFPIAGGAVAIGYNISGACTAGADQTDADSETLDLTSAELSQIYQGTLTTWGGLAGNNPWLTTDGCSGTLTRVDRSDVSGTTEVFKSYLALADPSTLCDGTTWSHWVAYANNQAWPSTSACSAPTAATASSSGNMVSVVEGNPGDIGYSELGLWSGYTSHTGVGLAHVESAAYATSGTAPEYIDPGSGTTGSNCNLSANGLPGGATPQGAVGLAGTNADWGIDSSPSKWNLNYQGSNYPICGLTFDLVYQNLTASAATGTSPELGLTNDQLRTLYSFFTYIFSPLGQSYVNAGGYDQLPAAWLPTLREGFQYYF
jgi:ABC-type phosphate transport system substrate-binding protein